MLKRFISIGNCRSSSVIWLALAGALLNSATSVAESDEQIAERLQALDAQRPGWAQVYGEWGGSLAVFREVARTKRWTPWGTNTLPDRFSVVVVDIKTHKLTAVNIERIKQVTHLGNDGSHRVAAGFDDKGAWRLVREVDGQWELMPLPKEVQKSSLHRLVRSDGPLAISIPDAVFRFLGGHWQRTPLPDPGSRVGNAAVEADGLLIGSTFYIGWWNPGDSTEGGFLAIDLEAKAPAWRSIYGAKDPREGIEEYRAVVVLTAGPKGQILLDAESDLDHARVYQYNGFRWQKRVDIVGQVPADPAGLVAWGNGVSPSGLAEGSEDAGDLRIDRHGVLHMLGPRGIFALRENKLVRLVPGPMFRPNSLFIDDAGNLLAGTTLAGLLLFEKVDNGYDLHELRFP